MKSTLLLVAFLVGCTSGEPLDPLGTITATVTYGPGNCGVTGTVSFPVTITQGASGKVFTQTDPEVTLAGGASCSEDSCEVHVDRGAPGSDAHLSWRFTGTLAVDGHFVGNGEYRETRTAPLGGSTQCIHTLTVSGAFSGQL